MPRKATHLPTTFKLNLRMFVKRGHGNHAGAFEAGVMALPIALTQILRQRRLIQVLPDPNQAFHLVLTQGRQA